MAPLKVQLWIRPDHERLSLQEKKAVFIKEEIKEFEIEIDKIKKTLEKHVHRIYMNKIKNTSMSYRKTTPNNRSPLATGTAMTTTGAEAISAKWRHKSHKFSQTQHALHRRDDD